MSTSGQHEYFQKRGIHLGTAPFVEKRGTGQQPQARDSNEMIALFKIRESKRGLGQHKARHGEANIWAGWCIWGRGPHRQHP